MNQNFNLRDFLSFEKMISPAFLTVLYYIEVVLTVLACLYFIFKGIDSYYGGNVMILGGLVGLIIGPFLIRLIFELLIVTFQIHARLSSIDYTLRGNNIPPVTPAGPSPVNPPFTPVSPVSPAAFEQPIAPVPATPASEFAMNTTPAAAGNVPVQEYAGNGSQVSQQASVDPYARPIAFPDLPNMKPFDPFKPSGTASPAAAFDFKQIPEKLPNLPLIIASAVLLICVVSPYASIGPDLPFVGNVLGNTFSIKNSPFGIAAVLGALGMVVTSAGGMKWLFYLISYGVTILASVIALLGESSLFTQVSRIKSGFGKTVDSSLSQFVPGADKLADQMVQNAPGASQFLNMSFYLLIITALFAGYWAFSGKYREKGFINLF